MMVPLTRSGLWLFVREFLTAPSTVGAVLPSSRRLARCLAERVPSSVNGMVIELGAGTGVVTQALLERGVTPSKLCIIERSPAFVRHLKARFPAIRVIQGDASQLVHLLPRSAHVGAIVSSLPLRALPPEEAALILRQWCLVLAPDGTAIQFTYDLRRNGPSAIDGLALQASSIVWRNLPPARVLTLQHNRRLRPSDMNPRQ